MKDIDKTKEQLIDELAAIHQQIAELKVSETEHKHRERALQESSEYADNIVATVREPLVVLDADLRVILANRSFYSTFKVTPEDTEGKLVYNLGDRQWDIPRLREFLEEILPKNTSFDDFEVEHSFETIGYKAMLLNARRIHQKENQTRMILLAIEDITERRQMQERLLASERLATLGQFSGNIAHELRNPLGVIDSSVYYLKTKLKDADEKTQQHLDRIKSSVVSSTAIIESLLNLTRVDKPHLGRLNLVAITADAIAASKVPSAVSIMNKFSEDEVAINADGEQLRMAFKNVIKNAVEAMDGKGTLTVTACTTADGKAEVSFTDTGSGIAAENLERVFQPLFSTKAKGIGLGLSIAKTIINKHGGTIEAKSEPGKGANIIIKFPLFVDKDEEA
jgi:two-component system CheB/CheR fusion protein